ncbi:NADH-quinone oxidoreductase subunit NuoK [Nocardia africana]|uniref:NADH-quinone oxidoreductase subunit NuoK n=1 Tax=Nocardia africana TaxID=134964 RepID=UPI0027DFEBFF|nr:NADH-quinone oxidoreductase subunit K [Nocardia africana]
MNLPEYLVLAAALFSVGLFGVLSQQSIVMVMMGLELMINAVSRGGGGVLVFRVALGGRTGPRGGGGDRDGGGDGGRIRRDHRDLPGS